MEFYLLPIQKIFNYFSLNGQILTLGNYHLTPLMLDLIHKPSFPLLRENSTAWPINHHFTGHFGLKE